MSDKINKLYCGCCTFQSDLRDEQNKHIKKDPKHWLSSDKQYANKYPVDETEAPIETIVQRLRETIDFLKVESIGGVWNTPQLIDMLEDHFKAKPRGKFSI